MHVLDPFMIRLLDNEPRLSMNDCVPIAIDVGRNDGDTEEHGFQGLSGELASVKLGVPIRSKPHIKVDSLKIVHDGVHRGNDFYLVPQ